MDGYQNQMNKTVSLESNFHHQKLQILSHSHHMDVEFIGNIHQKNFALKDQMMEIHSFHCQLK